MLQGVLLEMSLVEHRGGEAGLVVVSCLVRHLVQQWELHMLLAWCVL